MAATNQPEEHHTMTSAIADLIKQSGAWLDEDRSGDLMKAKKNKQASIAIANNYRAPKNSIKQKNVSSKL